MYLTSGRRGGGVGGDIIPDRFIIFIYLYISVERVTW